MYFLYTSMCMYKYISIINYNHQLYKYKVEEFSKMQILIVHKVFAVYFKEDFFLFLFF